MGNAQIDFPMLPRTHSLFSTNRIRGLLLPTIVILDEKELAEEQDGLMIQGKTEEAIKVKEIIILEVAAEDVRNLTESL